MQLELNHICAYLPFEVKYKDRCEGYEGIRELTMHNIQWCLDEGILLLRPLSSLTKPITHNGETFVPIVELAKIGTRENSCYVTNDNIGTCYVDAEYQKKGFFIYHPNGYFMWQVGKNAEPLTVWNQKKLFQKLYEWHFDLDNLIDQNLAINLETLK